MRALSAVAVVGLATGAGVLAVFTTDTPRGCPLSGDQVGRFVRIDGGGFVKGAHPLYREEGKPAQVFVSPFFMQIHEVTNEQFRAFVEETGYVTEAEKGGGSARFSPPTSAPRDFRSWWRLDEGATWQTPLGPGSSLEGKAGYPVVHVTLDDARAFAAWAGGRLPTEVEWEYAAARGLFGPSTPESAVRGPDGAARANIWTGAFPRDDSGEDGFAGVAPVGCYEASRVGLYDMIGNVWEWTETRFSEGRYTIKGGSYLCSPDYCQRYRPAARQGLEPDFSTAHVGFRVVKDVEERS